MIVLMQVRLLMSYVITHPEKMDDARQQQWQRLAHLTDMDMNTINNLELLGVPVKKRGNTKSGIGLTFGRKRKRAVRKVFCQSGQSWVCMSAQVFGGGGRLHCVPGALPTSYRERPLGQSQVCTESLAGPYVTDLWERHVRSE